MKKPRIKINKDTLKTAEVIIVSDNYISNRFWAIDQDYVDLDKIVFVEEKVEDDFLDRDTPFMIPVKFVRQSLVVEELIDTGIKIAGVIPTEDDLYEEWAIIPVILSIYPDAYDLSRIDRNPENFFMCFVVTQNEETDRLIFLSYEIFRLFGDIGLEFIPVKSNISDEDRFAICTKSEGKIQSGDIVGVVAGYNASEEDSIRQLNILTNTYSDYKLALKGKSDVISGRRHRVEFNRSRNTKFFI